MIDFETFMFVLIFLVLFCVGWFLGYILDCIQKKQKKGLKTMTSFYNLRQGNRIFEQVLLFAGTLLPNEKIIVSREDYIKIITAQDSYGYFVVKVKECSKHPFHVAGFELQTESINNFPRAEFGEKRTNCNFKLK